MIVPYSWSRGIRALPGMPQNRKVDGFADPRFRLSVNLYGAPALTLEEFAAYEQNVIVGVSVQVAAPLDNTTTRGPSTSAAIAGSSSPSSGSRRRSAR